MAESIAQLRRIWLIGGTQESATLATAIAAAQLSCVISVTTEAARGLYPLSPYLVVVVGRLTTASLPNFWQTWQVVAVLDASHPFAMEISQLAIAVATHFSMPYLRFERPGITPEVASGRSGSPSQPAEVLSFTCFDSLLESGYLTGQRVLLTIGYRELPRFQPWQERATLFVRILPSLPALAGAIAAGFTPERIMAMRPPISASLERALWQQWQISTVVTKASGAAGGEDVKRQVAADLGINLVTITRPDLKYPNQTREIAIALQFCQQQIG